MLPKPHVAACLVSALTHIAQGMQHLGVYFSWIGLPRHGKAGGKAKLFSDPLFEPQHFGMIAIEQAEEACLSSGGSLDAAKPQLCQAMFDFFQIQHQVVRPKAGPLADRRRLGWLEVGETQAGQIFMLLGEPPQVVNHAGQATGHNPQAVTNQEQIGVVGDKATGCPPVDDATRLRTYVAKRMHVRHDIVPERFFMFGGPAKINVVHLRLHGRNLLSGDGETEFGLSLGQRDPKPAPSAKLPLRTPDAAHFVGGVTLNERVVILIVRHTAILEGTGRVVTKHRGHREQSTERALARLRTYGKDTATEMQH